jgi:hypothetical protein
MTETTHLDTNIEFEETEEQITLEGTEVLETQAVLTLEEIVEHLVTEDGNAYYIHKIVNKIFELEGVDRKVPPQMIYNYSRNAMIAPRDTKPNRDHLYTRDQIVAFVTKFTTKRINK